MKLYLSAAAILAVLLLWGVSGTEDAVNDAELNSYCKMVDLYVDTDGAAGWPDYDVDKECG